jgi:hypothetical protein
MTNEEQPKRRGPGRPARGRTPFVRITVNLDPDLYAMIEHIADSVGIPASRVLNAILRKHHDRIYVAKEATE